MQIAAQQRSSLPMFPAPLALPLRLLPGFLHSRVLVTALNHFFARDLVDGELDFLRNKVLRIEISDVGLSYGLTLAGSRLAAVDSIGEVDLRLRGNLYDYLLLATREEDADTLFFNRRLSMQGDTELGLYLKNFLDALELDPERLSGRVAALLHRSLPVYERLCGR